MPGGAGLLVASACAAGVLLIVRPDVREIVRTRLPGGPAPRGTERVTVARVIDGDTFSLVDGRHVRIIGLDAPETHNPALAGPQPLGDAATDRLRAMVEGREVGLEVDTTAHDRYGRMLRHVWCGRLLVAESLVRAGLAHALPIPPDLRHADRFAAAESDARAARRGVWGLPRPTPLPLFAAPPP